jgi:hypothetical protein
MSGPLTLARLRAQRLGISHIRWRAVKSRGAQPLTRPPPDVAVELLLQQAGEVAAHLLDEFP